MKTWKAVAVVLLGMALAAPVWGHSNEEWLASKVAYREAEGYPPSMYQWHPDPIPFAPYEGRIDLSRVGGPHSLRARVQIQSIEHCDPPRGEGEHWCTAYWDVVEHSHRSWRTCCFSLNDGPRRQLAPYRESDRTWNLDLSFEQVGYDAEIVFVVSRRKPGLPFTLRGGGHIYDGGIDATRHIHYRTPSAPGTNPPTPPSEPEPPEPETPSEPEPEPPESCTADSPFGKRWLVPLFPRLGKLRVTNREGDTSIDVCAYDMRGDRVDCLLNEALDPHEIRRFDRSSFSGLPRRRWAIAEPWSLRITARTADDAEGVFVTVLLDNSGYGVTLLPAVRTDR